VGGGSPPAEATSQTLAVAQAYYNKKEGTERLGDRNRRRPMGFRSRIRSCKLFELECMVYMVKCSFEANHTAE